MIDNSFDRQMDAGRSLFCQALSGKKEEFSEALKIFRQENDDMQLKLKNMQDKKLNTSHIYSWQDHTFEFDFSFNKNTITSEVAKKIRTDHLKHDLIPKLTTKILGFDNESHLSSLQLFLLDKCNRSKNANYFLDKVQQEKFLSDAAKKHKLPERLALHKEKLQKLQYPQPDEDFSSSRLMTRFKNFDMQSVKNDLKKIPTTSSRIGQLREGLSALSAKIRAGRAKLKDYVSIPSWECIDNAPKEFETPPLHSFISEIKRIIKDSQFYVKKMQKLEKKVDKLQQKYSSLALKIRLKHTFKQIACYLQSKIIQIWNFIFSCKKMSF